MDRATQLALNRINQRFYAAIAQEWCDKRKKPWPGFEAVWQTFYAATRGNANNAEACILDLGCGDGRFAQFLADRAASCEPNGRLVYLGLDSSEALLDRARGRKLGSAFCFQQTDFVAEPIACRLGEQRFGLIVVLGVLHHIPGFEQRARLVRTLAQQLTTAGSLVLTVWRLDQDARFATRAMSFAAYNRGAEEPIDLDELEPGDTLLRWGDGDAPPRYCHFPDVSELVRLVEESGLCVRTRFYADGHRRRMNEYVVLNRRPT